LLASFVIIQDPITFVVALVFTGIFWAFVNVNSLPLVYDHGDERRIGAYTGLYYFASQLAAVLGPTMGGVTVDLLGDQYRWLFMYGAIFMFLALLAITRVKQQPSTSA
jgi:MFS family permease